MSQILDETTRNQLKEILGRMPSKVKLVFFKKDSGCPTCSQQLKILSELASVSANLELSVRDLVLNGDEALAMRVERAPSTAVVGAKDFGIRFCGVTAGYEFTSLLEAIVMASTGSSGLDAELEEAVKKLPPSINVKVFVTPTCPYCPKMAKVANQFAVASQGMRVEIIEAAEFPALVDKYGVSGVPKTVINDGHSFEGAVPAWSAYLEVLKAVDPDEHARISEAIRKEKGGSKTRPLEPSHTYELMIVGGGPAAMSAAIYASRKGLDTGLIAKKLGGQVGYTAEVDNYLGMPAIGGAQMVEQFREHMERHPIAMSIGTGVKMVTKDPQGFLLEDEDGKSYRAASVIYSAGKEFKRLGVPGEEKFIGKGISFCATCDAPLYGGKRVAVVGGGNSAITAVRDLAGSASEVHLVHRQREFRADKALIDEIMKMRNLKIHTPMVVESFLGGERLEGVRVASKEDGKVQDISIDGVFLEIGLAPNTDPVKGLLALNQWGEIKTERDLSTSVEGFFAAGDATDVRDKQISVAVGQGATAALSAHKYLAGRGYTRSRADLKESWE